LGGVLFISPLLEHGGANVHLTSGERSHGLKAPTQPGEVCSLSSGHLPKLDDCLSLSSELLSLALNDRGLLVDDLLLLR